MNQLKEKIEDIYSKYPHDKYPHALGLYKKDDSDIIVGYYFQDENGKWKTNMNENIYWTFDCENDLYNLLAQGYKPFYISDNIHIQCWKDAYTLSTCQYHHGRQLYFNYCKDHNVTKEYMSQLDESISDGMELFLMFDKDVKMNAKLLLKKFECSDSKTLQNYFYILNEPQYENAVPLYTLFDVNQGSIISYFSYDDGNNIVQIFAGEYPFIRDLQDWGFDDYSLFFEPLQEHSQILYMDKAYHEYVMFILDEHDSDDFKDCKKGVVNYLKYVQKHNVNKCLDEETQLKMENNLRKFHVISKKSKSQER